MVDTCDTYTWVAAGNILITTSGIYTHTFTNVSGCDSVHTLELNINTNPEAAFVYKQQNICKPVISFTNTSDSYSSSYWSLGDNNFSEYTNPIHTYDESGEYLISLVVENIFGCIDSVSSYVKAIDSDENLFIPNSFTPNENELNEVFRISADTLQGYGIWIYNIHGELLLYSDDIEQGWDGYYNGRICQNGSYVFRLQYLCGEATKVKIGTVTLIR
jgi:gliding motility-associated-like protein